jgi:hypothetical protein
VLEAKKEGVTLTGVETQSDKYTKGLPAGLPRWSNPLPFAYQTTESKPGYHAALFMEATREPPMRLQMRLYKVKAKGEVADLRGQVMPTRASLFFHGPI